MKRKVEIKDLTDIKGELKWRLDRAKELLELNPGNSFEFGAEAAFKTALRWVEDLDNYNESKGRTSRPVLERLLTYKAPPYPESYYLKGETYDNRVNSEHDILTKVPANFADCLVFDVLSNAQRQHIPIKFADTIVMQYNTARTWETFIGFRPWTHWNFIQSLHRFEIITLEREVREMLNCGRDWEKESDDLNDLEPEYRDETWRKSRGQRLDELALNYTSKVFNPSNEIKAFDNAEFMNHLKVFISEVIK